MKKWIHTIKFYLLYLALIFVTDIIVTSIIHSIFDAPEWTYIVVIILASIFYSYVFIKYRVRIDIKIKNRQIINYDSEGK